MTILATVARGRGTIATFVALAAVAVLAALPASAQQAAAHPYAEYKLGPRDLVEIRVLEIPELNVERRVTETGKIALPMVGDFDVAGLTATEFQNKLATILRQRYVNRANVSIVIKEFANKPVSIVGAVQRPGSLNVSGRWDLLQAISAAGGLNERAGKRIFVLRKGENGTTETIEVSVEDLFTGATDSSIPIYPGDVVNIPARTTFKIFALGEVRQPGALEFTSDDRVTVLSVIAKAGGLTDRASKHVRIRRKDKDGKDVELRADYNRIVSGKAADPELQPDDVIVIKASFF
ncbi:MAG: SLBB domain-containing protein [Thermoanaerobaculia bacterium]